MHLQSSLLALATVPLALAAPTHKRVACRATSGLNTDAVAAGKKYFGTAWDISNSSELADTPYMAILNSSSEFGILTPGNVQKWAYTEPTQGTFDYTQADQSIAISKANGQMARCHNLVWYNQLPSWVTSGTWTNETLIAAMQNHITNLVTHFGSECYAWDVVNEALADDGTYRTDVFYNTIGPSYIPIAFKAAQDAAASANLTVKLYYNDYNIEYSGDKATAAVAIVQDIQNQGIQIDGVGLQSHFIVGSTPSKADQIATMEKYTALGLEVAQTELDIRHSSLPASTAALAQQETDFENTVAACVAVEGCVGTTTWGFTDKFSWIPSTFSGQGAALQYDENLVKKPAYTGIVTALVGNSTTA